MLQLVLAAPRSGSGKTTAACALLAALTCPRADPPVRSSRGRTTSTRCSTARCWASKATISDLFFSAPQTARALYARHAAGHGAAVVEGAMGYYDALAA